jgi:hypothetical protein
VKRPKGVELAPEVDAWFRTAADTPSLRDKFKKAKKALKNMREVGPHYPAFETHAMNHLKGPDGATIWNSYVENHTSNAWRMYWLWKKSTVYVVSIGPHDHDPGQQPMP